MEAEGLVELSEFFVLASLTLHSSDEAGIDEFDPILTSLARYPRADNRCEYCGISQIGQVATFHIDHIVPSVAGGTTTADNLALACVSCFLRKGVRQRLEDPSKGQ